MDLSYYWAIMKRLCVGCGACMGICPTNAISPASDRGIATIDIDIKRCSRCCLCIRICPILNYMRLSFITKPMDKAGTKTFIGYATDIHTRYNAASGGVLTALLMHLLERGKINGVLVVKMRVKEIVPFIASKPEELKEAQGSIYFPMFSLKLIRQLKGVKGKYAVVGLPCQIDVIKKLAKTNLLPRNKVEYLFGLRCYHVNAPWYLDYMINHMLRLHKDRVYEITARKRGWPGGLSVKSELGTYFIPQFYNRKLGVGLWNPLALEHLNAQPGCLICINHDNVNADITFGDAWLPRIMNNDKIGTSLIIVRTKKGFKLIREAASEGKIVIYSMKEEENLCRLTDDVFKSRQQILRIMVKEGFIKTVQKRISRHIYSNASYNYFIIIIQICATKRNTAKNLDGYY